MIPFVIVAVAMLAVACAWIIVPLLASRREAGVRDDAVNLAVLRDQRAELDVDVANGVLSADQYEVAKLELDRRVLDEQQAAQRAAATAARGSAWTAALVAGGFPIAAIVLYLLLGTPTALLPGAASPAIEARSAPTPQEIDGLIAKVRERLAANPNDLDGWVVLARTYYTLGRANDAAAAYERATALAPNDADLLADYADAIGVTQGRSLEGKPEALIARALQANPAHWKANALAGTIAFKRAQYAKAIEHWERVRAGVPADSPIVATIEASIAEARALAQGGASAGAPVAAAKPPPAPPAPPAPASAKITGTVSLAPAVAAGAAPDDTVFVFARPADGSRMPLALVRAKVRDLPLAFTLDDSTAMVAGRNLSEHRDVVVGARVSRSGNAMPQSGDLEAPASSVKLGSTDVRLVVDRKLP